MAKPKKGILITFEGLDGAGKSTLINKVQAWLNAQEIPCIVSREPGGHPVSEMIRKVLLEQSMEPLTELFLYEAARAEHTAKTLRPALEKGLIVLCDRYTDSSLAYQGSARGLPWETVKSLNRIATQNLVPTLTVWIDVDPKISLARAQDANRFEAEGLEFQKKVRRGFLRAKKQSPSRWLILPASTLGPNELGQKTIKKLSGLSWIKSRVKSRNPS